MPPNTPEPSSQRGIRSSKTALLCGVLALSHASEAVAGAAPPAPESGDAAQVQCGAALAELGFRSASSPIAPGNTVRVIVRGKADVPETFGLRVEAVHDPEHVVAEVIETPTGSRYSAPAIGQKLELAESCVVDVLRGTKGARRPSGAPALRGFHVGVGPVRWTADGGSESSASNAVIGALARAGIEAAPVLHPADAPVFMSGSLNYRAHENVPTRDGSGSIIAGSLMLVAGIAGGVTVGLFVDPEIGAGAGGGVSGLGVLLVTIGALIRARHRREHTVEWTASGSLVVRARNKAARTVEIERSGERRCEERRSCLESVGRAEEDAHRAVSDDLGNAVRLAGGL